MARQVWLALGGEVQEMPARPDQWMPYNEEVSFLLGQNYKVMVQEQGSQAHLNLLDLSMFTEPPLPYTVCKGRIVDVVNPSAPANLRGQRSVAGYPISLWDSVKGDMLPKEFGMCAVVPYFYQVHHDHVQNLEQLERFLADATGRAQPPRESPRRRMVILLQFPSAMSNPDRFRKRRTNASLATSAPSPEPQAPAEDVTVVDQDKIPAIYEWWFGPAPPQAQCPTPPIGRWRMYHPQVCRRLEAGFQANASFRNGDPMDVDGIRYMIRKITPESPFDFFGQPSREPVLRDGKITVEHPCYSDMDRETGNCFVQFQKGNPCRRRPARRRPDAADIAKLGVMTGNPCSICFSDDGSLTGCMKAHLICKGCLRNGLRSMAGDTLTVEHLLCGCFNRETRAAILVLAERADIDLQNAIKNPPRDRYELQDFQHEVEDTRRKFDIGSGDIPPTVYVDKLKKWFHTVNIKDIVHLYYVCSHPSCADKEKNWMLKEQFEREYQMRGLVTWTCPAGHKNSVLPSDDEVRDCNKNILLHPEYYQDYGGVKMRRYRLCDQCVKGGFLTTCVHDGGCKHWPGSGTGHRHVYCFCCLRVWGTECDHSQTCTDPGIQQVRKLTDRLEVGYVSGPAYLRWLQNKDKKPPPTIFPSGQVTGEERQAALGMTNRSDLLRESQAGTR